MNIKEVWKPVKGFEGSYEVSSLGNLKSLAKYYYNPLAKRKVIRAERILKINCKDGSGYHGNTLTNIKGISKNQLVHRLVAIAFIPNPKNKRCVNHKNGIKTDNRVENLEWVTHSENRTHAYKIGLLKNCNGANNPSSKLTNELVREIRAKYVPYKYPVKRLASEYGMSIQAMYDITQRKSWMQV